MWQDEERCRHGTRQKHAPMAVFLSASFLAFLFPFPGTGCSGGRTEACLGRRSVGGDLVSGDEKEMED